MRTLVWFRGKDLRLRDHAPLHAAIAGGEVIPCFVLDPLFFEPRRAQRLPHRMQFLVESLDALVRSIAARGSRLVIVRGRSVDVIPRLARRWKVDRVAAHRWSEPMGRERDHRVAEALSVPFDLYEGETLVPPGTLRSGAGTPYRVFTPFARAAGSALVERVAWPSPRVLPPLPGDVKTRSAAVPDCRRLGIAPNRGLIRGGEQPAQRRLARSLASRLADYDRGRDALGEASTSRLSADLHFGVLSVRAVWNAVADAGVSGAGPDVFRNQLWWREFAYHTVWDMPAVLDLPFREGWRDFPWRTDPEAERDWAAWCDGRTGYPVVDAAARQLLEEGFVHNRARMIAASFLTKHLLLDYRRGEAHYLRWLVDGDWAANNLGWQWSAGCGCDAQPWFRVFSPERQGRRFDAAGDYVRRWVPELSRMPDRHIHAPAKAPAAVLRDAGVRLGVDYPEPLVSHHYGRGRFLAAANRAFGR
jgi:deoxyribodipyrimidine photo-lyase